MARRSPKKKKLSEREARELETYESLKELLEQLDWRVSLARSLDGQGGHCIVRGERRVILKSQLPVSDKTDVLVDALRRVDLQGIHVRPDLRELIEPGSLADEGAEAAAP